VTDGRGERLQKVMAAAGIGSRRRCEELILAGRVEVDRRAVRKLGTRVDAQQQEIRVDGDPLKTMRRAYFLVNKPVGVVSTNFDPSGRPRVIDLLPPTKERLFTVGRLDLSSEGLMLVTNDGELANRLTHPRYGVEKTYHALVAGRPNAEVLESLRRGVHLAEGMARVASVKVRKDLKQSMLLEIVLAEGRNREIRRILAKVGHKVLRLKRVAIGPLRLKDIEPGQWRPLRGHELDELQSSHGAKRGKAGHGKHRRKPVGRGSPPAGRGSPDPDQARTEGLPPSGTGRPSVVAGGSVGDRPQQVGDRARQGGDRAQLVGNRARQGGERPQQKRPKQVGKRPKHGRAERRPRRTVKAIHHRSDKRR
ncbi:MAG: pseudouridine synthase, partial [Pirellulales bacterium]